MTGGYALRRLVHVSWIVAAGCVGIIVGVVTAQELSTFASIAWLLTGTGLLISAAMKGRAWCIALAVVGGTLIGLWRGSVVQESLVEYTQLYDKTVLITGTVNEDIDANTRGQSVLRLRSIMIAGNSLPGTLWVTSSTSLDVRRSDKVTVSGRLESGFGNFSGSVYSASIKRVERPVPGDIALQARDHFAAGVKRSLTETEASLGLGYLVGQRRGLPEELDTALQAAGLTHIVVASGYNLTILVRLARRLFEKVSKYLSLLASSAMIAGFIAVTGLSPSMSRAGLIAGLSLLAWYYGRRFHPLVLLPLAMAITVMLQPSYAWGDIGWQLSFAAFGGVMILAPLLQAYLFGDKPERTVRRIFIETVAATIATLPILLSSFGQFSVIGPIANILILPLVPLAMLTTFLAGISGLLIPMMAVLIGMPAQIILTYMTNMALMLGSIPWALQETEIAAVGVLLSYGVIIAGCMYMRWATGFDLRTSSVVE